MANKVQDFNPENWVPERQSGYLGYRNVKDDEWIYEKEFHDRVLKKARYEEDYKLLADFRYDYLPFGKYPEYVLQEFLDKKHN